MVRKLPNPDRVAPKVIEKAREKRAVKPTSGSVKAQKTAARLAAVQALYQMHLNDQSAAEAVREFLVYRVGFEVEGDVFVPAHPQLLQDIVLGAATRDADVRRILVSALAQGGRGEVELLLEAILRAGIYELIAHGDIDSGIIINDYLSVAASFYDGKEPKLVNAVLDRVAKNVRS